MSGPHLFLTLSGCLGAIVLAEPLPESSLVIEPPPVIETSIVVPTPAASETPAATEDETPPELTATIQEQDAAIKTLEQQDAEARAALRLWYASSLDTMRQEAISQGDLDHVIALDLERQRIDTEITAEEKAQLFYTLRELRARFERQRADQMRHATAEARAGLQRYAVALDHLASVFLQHGNAGAARVVVRARLSMLGAAPVTAVCSSTHYASSGGNSSSTSSNTHTSSAPASPTKSGPAKPPGIVQSSGPGRSPGGVPATIAANGESAAAVKSKAAAVAGKIATAHTVPSATSVSAPPTVQVAKQTIKTVAPQSSGKGAPASRGTGTSAPSGFRGAPASAGPSGGFVVR